MTRGVDIFLFSPVADIKAPKIQFSKIFDHIDHRCVHRAIIQYFRLRLEFFENSNFCMHLRARTYYYYKSLSLHYLGNCVAKVLVLGKTQIYLVFLSLNRTFGLTSLDRLHLGKTQIYLVFLSVCTTFVGK